jgi:hydrogenase maturation protein HypF
MARTRIRVTGTVQGVGFRPFVYRHANELGLGGFVRNDSAGVLIEVEGAPDRIADLERRLVEDPPPLARVASVLAETIAPIGDEPRFRIEQSDGGGRIIVPVSVDTATCPSCLAEMDDSRDRRYRYPFINCTSCGPRYTIVQSVPYDRPSTTMARFTMCPDCHREYEDARDRRFHAEPNACPRCGPQLQWWDRNGGADRRAGALSAAIACLRTGGIVGVKGLGGYHLAVDAGDEHAVAELRRRKARDDKPFAVMVADVDTARALCALDSVAEAALISPRRPIVLAPRRADAPVASGVAPGLPELGVLLPYTPLHHLLLAGMGRPLVMTSGNRSDEPIAHDDDDAHTRLRDLVDGMLTHDRDIHIRCDDSVARASGGRLQLLRRSRGYAPEPIAMPIEARLPVLALGGELKSTVAVARDSAIVASHHIGDLEHLASYTSFLQAVEHLCALCGVTPRLVAHDLHPEYLSTKYALELDLPTLGVQHHHAHVASCLVEHRRTDAVLGLTFDGLGYGTDGTMWGGEALVADLRSFTRVGHLLAVPMPGGVAAIREPWRMSASWCTAALGPTAAAAALAGVDVPQRDAVLALAARHDGLSTTSAGRFFDAIAALLVGRTLVRYEAQAAIELEAAARAVDRRNAPRYDGTVRSVDVDDAVVLDPTALVARVVEERASGVPSVMIAAGVHEAFGAGAAAWAAGLARRNDLDTVALTGGVFQNARLSEIVESALVEQGLRVLVHAQVPPNDGGISIGQAAIAVAATRR